MAAISGKNGKILANSVEIADVRDWTLNRSNEDKPYNSSSTAGETRRVAGNNDSSGSFNIYSEDGNIANIERGSVYTLHLYVNATQFYSVPAFIQSIEPTVSIESADLVGVSITFAQNGAITNPV
jgi:hypothetical protein